VIDVAFYAAAAIAVLATVLVITRSQPVHALLYFVVSLFAVGVLFLLLGAPFAAVLEVIVYAGAIMVLFVFVVMLLNLAPATVEREHAWLAPGVWLGPSVLAAALLLELGYVLLRAPASAAGTEAVGPHRVATTLLGPYLLAVELASMLLLAGMVGAYHLGRRELPGRGSNR
jgi:NADH-quinone oxidoreductase subunit J